MDDVLGLLAYNGVFVVYILGFTVVGIVV